MQLPEPLLLLLLYRRWWWRSFLCGGSTGLFIFGYCFYYYYARSDMTGLMQVTLAGACAGALEKASCVAGRLGPSGVGLVV